jgi:hypothetical protein
VIRALTLLLTLMVCALAQSYFNTQALGELVGPGDARAAGTGDAWALSFANPGLLVNLNKVSFSLGTFGSMAVGSSGASRRAVGTARPAALDIAAPLPAGFRLFAGINERFDQSFDIWSESLPDTAYRRHVVGRGSIHVLRAGLARSFFGLFCAGIGYDGLVGGTREDWRFEIGQGDYTSVDTIEADYSASGFEAGLSLQHRLLTIAALYRSGTDLTVSRLLRVHGVVNDTQRTSVVSLPHSLHLGVGVLPISRLSLTAGLDLLPWAGASIMTDTEPAHALGFANTNRVSLGAEYLATDDYPVRVGCSFGDAYFRLRPGNSDPLRVSQLSIHLGSSIPVPSFGSLDLSAALLHRRTALLSELAGRLTVTLSYHEAWSRRTRRWGY